MSIIITSALPTTLYFSRGLFLRWFVCWQDY